MTLHLSEVLLSLLDGQGWLGSRALSQSGWQEGCKLLCTSGQGHRWKHDLSCSLWGHCLPVFTSELLNKGICCGAQPHTQALAFMAE